jgi:hypothetical protein
MLLLLADVGTALSLIGSEVSLPAPPLPRPKGNSHHPELPLATSQKVICKLQCIEYIFLSILYKTNYYFEVLYFVASGVMGSTATIHAPPACSEAPAAAAAAAGSCRGEAQKEEKGTPYNRMLVFAERVRSLKERISTGSEQSRTGLHEDQNRTASCASATDSLDEAYQNSSYCYGDPYEGEWKNGMRHGHGVYRYGSAGSEDADVYEGEWRCDMRHAYGTYTSHTGEIYSGAWAHDDRNGEGICRMPDDSVYSGAWESNARHGVGRTVFANGDVHAGGYAHDRMHGPGVWACAGGGLVFEGDFDRGRQAGLGTITYPDGGVYEGGVRRHLRHGAGVYTCKEGVVCRGEWAEGQWVYGSGIQCHVCESRAQSTHAHAHARPKRLHSKARPPPAPAAPPPARPGSPDTKDTVFAGESVVGSTSCDDDSDLGNAEGSDAVSKVVAAERALPLPSRPLPPMRGTCVY